MAVWAQSVWQIGRQRDPVILQESVFQPGTTGPLPCGRAKPLVALCSLYPFFMTTVSSFLHPFHTDPLLKREAAPHPTSTAALLPIQTRWVCKTAAAKTITQPGIPNCFNQPFNNAPARVPPPPPTVLNRWARPTRLDPSVSEEFCVFLNGLFPSVLHGAVLNIS